MADKIIRVVTRASDGTLRTKEFENFDEILQLHEQNGIDDCSTDLTLRGLPIFRGLVGPMPENKSTVRYESPDVFEMLTKEWAVAKSKRRRRGKSATTTSGCDATDSDNSSKPKFVPMPKMAIGNPVSSPAVHY